MGLLLAAATTGLCNASQAWDSYYYHLPFAARLWRIIPAQAYVLSPLNEARYQGFPLAGEFLQGLLWKLTGVPEGANLLGGASIALFAIAMRWLFRVPASSVVLALFGIPVVLTHVTTAYLDIPSTLCLTLSLLLLLTWWTGERVVRPAQVGLFVVCLAFPANARFHLAPVVAMAWCCAFLVLRKKLPLGHLALFALCSLLVFATPLRNVVRFGNPAYPYELHVFGRTLPYVDSAYHSSPDYLEHTIEPVRFVFSLAEIGMRPMTDPWRWTVDQWTPSDHPGARMGGFFVGYVVVALGLFAWLLKLARGQRGRWRYLVFFGVLTFCTCWLPQAHELRYYLYWMTTLLCLVGMLAARAGRAFVLSLAGACSLAVVLFVSGGLWLRPSGPNTAGLAKQRLRPATLERVRAGDPCVWEPPTTLLYASYFTGGSHVIVEADNNPACASR